MTIVGFRRCVVVVEIASCSNMRSRFSLFLCLAMCGVDAAADDVRVIEKDGLLIQETRVVDRKPVAELKTETQQIIQYKEQFTTVMQQRQQSYYVPITEYRIEPRVYGKWNPFVEPRTVYERVPYTRYELRTNTVTVPQVRRDVIPVTQIVQQPTRKLRFVEEVKTNQVVLGPAPNRAPIAATAPPSVSEPTANIPAVASRPTPISPGSAWPTNTGLALPPTTSSRFESDPPRRPQPATVLTPPSIRR